MIQKGHLFILRNKVYMINKTLKGYDEYYIQEELNTLISLGIVEKIRYATEEDKKNNFLKLNEYPLDY